MLYRNKFKNRLLTASKPRGAIDRKRVHIVNIEPFAIVEPRELSRRSQTDSSSCFGIYRNQLKNRLLTALKNCFSACWGVFCVATLLLMMGCSSNSQSKMCLVGVDPSWRPLELEGKENNVTAFSTELLQEIGKLENIHFSKFTVSSWDNLIPGLEQKTYAAILSAMTPYIFNLKTYDFSDLYLHTGPVLVVPVQSPIGSMEDLQGKEIAVQPNVEAVALLEKQPGALIRYYDSIPKALNDIMNQTVDGALIGSLLANAYVQDLYKGQLKIITPPLNEEGLRFIMLHEKNNERIAQFNEGLEKLKFSGRYDALLAKWGLQSLKNPAP